MKSKIREHMTKKLKDKLIINIVCFNKYIDISTGSNLLVIPR